MRCEQAFTIPELVTGLVIASVVITAGFSLSSMIQRSSREDLLSMAELSKTDLALDQIVSEIDQSQKILINGSEIPAGCSVGAGSMFLAFQLPAQAYGKGDYQTQNTPTGVKTIAEQNRPLCPIVIGLKNPSNGEKGPRVLYRYGPGIDSKGFYQPTSVIAEQTLTILEGVHTGISGAPRSCNPGWTPLSMDGLEACVDPNRRTVQISVSKVIPTATGALSRYVKRSTSGGIRALDSSLIPVTQGSGGTGGKTNMFGQNVDCNGTTFLIDNSGSMIVKNRMERAKRELMAAIAKCSDGDMVNVFWFNSVFRKFRDNNVALNAISRNAINQFIMGINANGGTNPWGAMDSLMRDQSVKSILILTDGGTSTSGNCIAGGYKSYADCYAQYNATKRPSNPVAIKSVALGTSCSLWLGPLSTKNGGTCLEAK